MSNPTDGIVYSIPPALISNFAAKVGEPTLKRGGQLYWHHYTEAPAGQFTWDHLQTVGVGWGGMKQVFDGRAGVIYFVEALVPAKPALNSPATPASGGRLMWARHLGQSDGTFRWDGPRPVGVGWAGFKNVFSSGQGIVYVIETGGSLAITRQTLGSPLGGRLRWYKHLGYEDGTFNWQGPWDIAPGWGAFSHAFCGEPGVLYAINTAGDLYWYQHTIGINGASTLSQPKQVGTGWGTFEHVFYGGDGLIYAVQPESAGGHLLRYHHLGMGDGSFSWEGPVDMGTGWSGSEWVFANGDNRADTVISVPSDAKFCEYLDPAGSPTLGVQSYGIKTGGDAPRVQPITWAVDPAIAVIGVNLATVTQTIIEAFAVWQAVVPLVINQVNFDPGLVELTGITFNTITLGTGFLGQTTEDGRHIHFDNTTTFGAKAPLPMNVTVSLLAVAAHEIGHALGLLHNTNPASIMYPFNGRNENLGADDVLSIRALYNWSPQRKVPGIGTDSSPVVCACGNTLVMAWRGVGSDDNLYTCHSTDGINWSPQTQIYSAASADGPALAWQNGRLWLAHRGVNGDDALYYAYSNGDYGDQWSDVMKISGSASANGPALTIYQDNPMMVWRGVDGDHGLYFSFWNNGWQPQNLNGGTASTDRPCLVIDFRNLPRMIWRGTDGDDALYTADFNGSIQLPVWEPQQVLQWIVLGNGGAGTAELGVPGSLLGPSATFITRRDSAGNVASTAIVMVWRGVDGDQGLYYTEGAPGAAGSVPIDWSTQAQIPGVGSSHRPSIAVFQGRVFVVWKGIDGDTSIYTSIN